MSLGLSLSKGISTSLYSKAPVTFDGMKLKPSSDMSMRFYSIAGMAERPMLYAVIASSLRSMILFGLQRSSLPSIHWIVLKPSRKFNRNQVKISESDDCI